MIEKRILLRFPVGLLAAMLVAATQGVLRGLRPSHYFKEGRPFTQFHAVMLAAIGLLTLGNFHAKTRKLDGFRARLASPAAIWLLMSVGFFYLALDEVACFHEKLGDLVPRLLNLPDTPLTERIDSALVGVYGIVGLAALYAYRSELGLYRSVWTWLFVGFVLLGASVVLDLLTDDAWIFQRLLDDKARAKTWQERFALLEEVLKLEATAFFLLAFVQAHFATKGAVGLRKLVAKSGRRLVGLDRAKS